MDLHFAGLALHCVIEINGLSSCGFDDYTS